MAKKTNPGSGFGGIDLTFKIEPTKIEDRIEISVQYIVFLSLKIKITKL